MASVRLTSDMRSSIRKALLDHAFAAQREEIQTKTHALGAAVYDDLYPTRILDTMKALPRGFLPESTGVKCSFGSRVGHVFWGGERRLCADHDNGVAKVYEPSHRFSKAYDVLKREKDALKVKEQEARVTAEGVLNSVTTVNKLVEVWPEVEPFARNYVVAPATALTVPVEQLNVTFKLPAGKTKGKRK